MVRQTTLLTDKEIKAVKIKEKTYRLFVYTNSIAKKSIEYINRVDVSGIVKKLTEADSHEVARRVLFLIKNSIEYAIDYEYISSNVAAGIKPSKMVFVLNIDKNYFAGSCWSEPDTTMRETA